MIAVSSSGTGFRALATYLVHGRTGLEEGRIAWTSARNLPTADPQIAATLMRATAARNVRVERPVYHLALAFDPHDPVDRAAMERVADRVLAKLGLEGHQVLIVAHRDREHPHLHVLANRVHPETGKAWDRWQDLPTIQRVLREEERALGLRELAADRADARGAERGDDATPSALNTRPIPPWSVVVERARAALPAVREATSWDDVTAALDRQGLRLEGRGAGLVVTDGDRYAKASRVGPELTLRHLEPRLGTMPRDEMRDAERGAVPHETPPISRGPRRAMDVQVPALAPSIDSASERSIAHLVHDIAQLERARASSATQPDEVQAQAVERARRVQRAAAQERYDRASSALNAALARTFAEPERARAALFAATRTSGTEIAIARLRDQPEVYGPLAVIERSRGFGLVRGRDDTTARLAAREAASLTHEYVAARRALDASLQRSVRAPAVERPSPAVDVGRAPRRGVPGHDIPERDNYVAGRRTSPAAELLERGLRDAVRKLTPAELRQLHALLTRPQAALLTQLRHTMRDAVLGREAGDS